LFEKNPKKIEHKTKVLPVNSHILSIAALISFLLPSNESFFWKPFAVSSAGFSLFGKK